MRRIRPAFVLAACLAATAIPAGAQEKPIRLRTPTWAEVQESADFVRELVAAVRAAAQTGRTVDQAVAELRLPDRYSGYDMSQARQFVDAAYRELAAR